MPEYRFLIPKTTDVLAEAWVRARKQWQFWIVITIAVILTLLYAIFFFGSLFKEDPESALSIFLFPVIFPLIYILVLAEFIRKDFWKEFAQLNNWEYQEIEFPKAEDGLMFRQGRNNPITHAIRGVISSRPFRIFGYQFTTGYGKSSKTYFYTVFGFKFDGTFPNFFLDNHSDNRYNFSGLFSNIRNLFMEKVPLPEEFGRTFKLFSPKKYEVEALQIFTPDVLDFLLKLKLKHDIEFINQEMLVFVDYRIDSIAALEKELQVALEIKDLLEQKLNRIKFVPIGDMPHTL